MMLPYLFISYATEQHSIASELAETLKLIYPNVKWDNTIRRGTDWWEEILNYIQSASHFIVLLSHEWKESPYCQKEYEFANEVGCHQYFLIVEKGFNIHLDGPTGSQKIQSGNYFDDSDAFRHIEDWIENNRNKPPLLGDIRTKRPAPPIHPIPEISRIIDKEILTESEVQRCISELRRLALQTRFKTEAITLLNRLEKRDISSYKKQEIKEILHFHAAPNLSLTPPEKVRLPHVESSKIATVLNGLQSILANPTSFIQLANEVEDCLRANNVKPRELAREIGLPIGRSLDSYTYLSARLITDRDLLETLFAKESNGTSALGYCIYQACEKYVLEFYVKVS